MRPTSPAGIATACPSSSRSRRNSARSAKSLRCRPSSGRSLPRVRAGPDRQPASPISGAWACSATGSGPTCTHGCRRFEAEHDPCALRRSSPTDTCTRGYKPVHWCLDCRSALAEAEVEYIDKTSTAVDVAFPVRDSAELHRRAGLGGSVPMPRTVLVPIWTTTAMDAAGQPQAVALGAGLDYRLIEGRARAMVRCASCWCSPRLAGLCTCCATARSELPCSATFSGQVLEGLKLLAPLLRSARSRDPAGRLRDARCRYRRAVHTAPGSRPGRLRGQPGLRFDRHASGRWNSIRSVDAVFILPGTPVVEGQFIWKANEQHH
jgi:isoleucyl-tRNA synthetase